MKSTELRLPASGLWPSFLQDSFAHRRQLEALPGCWHQRAGKRKVPSPQGTSPKGLSVGRPQPTAQPQAP